MADFYCSHNYDKIDDIAARFIRLRFAAFFRADL